MKDLYSYIGITRQGLAQWRLRLQQTREVEAQVLWLVEKIRKEHTKMGLRKIYERMLPAGIGRDRFMELGRSHGLGIQIRRSGRRTTWSGSGRFPNRIAGRQLTGVNHVWVSDISFVNLTDGFGYITVIMDLYSRRLLAGIGSKGMETGETSKPALQVALRVRGIDDYNQNLTIHSDGGGQYYSRDFISLTSGYGIVNSMGKSVYENPAAERVIGTLKREYLLEDCYEDVVDMNAKLAKSLRLYNHERPHNSLPGNYTPVEFEEALLNWPKQSLPVYQISTYTSNGVQ